MSVPSVIVMAIGLSMDAFAVSISSGITIQGLRIRHALLIASFFGAFQAVMPVLGWSVGRLGSSSINAVGHWIAFFLLSIIGARMIYAGFVDEAEVAPPDPLNLYVLLMLSIATSIDALVAGVTLSLLNVSIVQPVAMIGCTTFLFSFVGTYIGDVVGHFFEKNFQVIGGLILIAIGTNILLEHLLC